MPVLFFGCYFLCIDAKAPEFGAFECGAGVLSAAGQRLWGMQCTEVGRDAYEWCGVRKRRSELARDLLILVEEPPHPSPLPKEREPIGGC